MLLLPFSLVASTLAYTWDFVFVSLFAFKLVKIVVHLCSHLYHLLHQGFHIPRSPTLKASDVTVIISRTGDLDLDFENCLTSILNNRPAKIIVATTTSRYKLVKSICTRLSPIIEVQAAEETKRERVLRAIRRTKTEIVVLANGHVFWERSFLVSALAPFDDHRIDGVATAKQVIRDYSNGIWSNFCNFIACTYVERQNFELTATNNIDGGFLVISSRLALFRGKILRSWEFGAEYLNETWLMGCIVPLNSGEDLFITRYLVNYGWKIHFQNTPEATVSINLGDPKKFFGKLGESARLIWRSNLSSIFNDFTLWSSQPWCVYAVCLSSFVNFALFYDAALYYSLYSLIRDSVDVDGYPSLFGEYELDVPLVCYQLFWLLCASRLVKIFPHFWRHPWDILYIPAYIIFAYCYTFIKLWALLTVFIP
ncbi:hypothetical protein MMC26_000885 [Xylographa opegraphella]|nr:hypothetical protein [Xylographa opegraphella]